jgi:hypothetical protein
MRKLHTRLKPWRCNRSRCFLVCSASRHAPCEGFPALHPSTSLIQSSQLPTQSSTTKLDTVVWRALKRRRYCITIELQQNRRWCIDATLPPIASPLQAYVLAIESDNIRAINLSSERWLTLRRRPRVRNHRQGFLVLTGRLVRGDIPSAPCGEQKPRWERCTHKNSSANESSQLVPAV